MYDVYNTVLERQAGDLSGRLSIASAGGLTSVYVGLACALDTETWRQEQHGRVQENAYS